MYLDSPYTTFDPETGRYSHNETNRWDNYRNRDRYNYTLDIKIKVPKNTSVKLNAINGGVIEARGIDAKLISANNINGPITLENIAGQTHVNALNKDINISYSKNPTEESTYKSLNGDINITFQKAFNAHVSHKTLNGDMYTNMETTKIPSKINVEKTGKKIARYKVNSNSEFKIGKGGVQLNFDLLNGDVTIKN